jgi:hypothetical protein
VSRPALRLGLLGVLAFAIALIVLWPARWLAPALPAGMHCADWSGSLWRGQCAGFQWKMAGAAPLNIERTQWRLQPLALLRGRLQADVELVQAPLQAQGRISSGIGGRLKMEHLNASGVLNRKLLAALPAGWSMHFELKDAGIEYLGGALHALSGLAIARELRDAQGNALGDYQLQFAPQPAAPFKGQLRDLAGPLQLAATVTINADRSWQLDGNASLRPGSPPSLARALDQLGGADLNGQRRISIAGTFD